MYKCPECNNEMEIIDETYCNYNSPKANKGEHTGNIYRCDNCEQDYLDDFLSSKLIIWNWEL